MADKYKVGDTLKALAGKYMGFSVKVRIVHNNPVIYTCSVLGTDTEIALFEHELYQTQKGN